MKFREKTYLITLTLFLVIFNAGIFSLAYYTYQKSVDAARSVCYAEESVIREAFAGDVEYLSKPESLQKVMETYGEFYTPKGIYLAFSGEENLQYSVLPEGLSAPRTAYSKERRLEGKRYFVISRSLDDKKIVMSYAKDISYLDEDFKTMIMVYVPTSLLASLFLAGCLFFVLRKLSRPLEQLRAATKEMTEGNLSYRAAERGKDEFAMLARDFNRMAAHLEEHTKLLEETAKMKQQMLDDLAHEMRTPLTSIRGYAEYLQIANIPDEEKTEATEYIISESERLKQIGERLLDEAFIRENGIRTQKANLLDTVETAMLALKTKARDSGVQLCKEAVSVPMECDPLLLGMLVTNLADNAIKACASRKGGTVTVGCGMEGEMPMLYVRDNGIGMDAKQLTRITEPFYRTDRSRSRSEGGTGLGLSLCAKIADAHGAVLRFSSAVGKGTEAKVIFFEQKKKLLQLPNKSRTNPTHEGSILSS